MIVVVAGFGGDRTVNQLLFACWKFRLVVANIINNAGVGKKGMIAKFSRREPICLQ